MALVLSRTDVEVFGGKQVFFFDVDFDSVTGAEIKTGMANVTMAVYVPNTSDKHGIVYLNYSDTGTTRAAGSVYIDSVTADDEGKLMVIGSA